MDVLHQRRARYGGPGQLLMHERAPESQFRIAGVSFDNRQEALTQCIPGQAVMFLREHDNPYDEHAVAIRRLDGESLGYVPRDLNQSGLFVNYSESFGVVASLGPAAGTDPILYGARVTVCPSLSPLVAHAVPDNIMHAVRKFETYIPASLWETIQSVSLEASENRCNYSGLKENLVTVPVWDTDSANKVMTLKCFLTVTAGVRTAEAKFLEGDAPLDYAIRVFCLINSWKENEALDYWAYQKQVLAARKNERWTLNLWCLHQMGLPDPVSLRHVL